MYFCTAADDQHFIILLNLIGSIFRHNDKNLKKIAVYNLGLTEDQLHQLSIIDRVEVFDVEKVNPLITTPLFSAKHGNWDRWVKGMFSWKPVIIKQSLDMFPYVVYADSGTTVLRPLNGLFEHIKQNGYFLTDCGRSIKWMTPKHIIKKMNLTSEKNKWLLEDTLYGIDAGFQGVSRSLKEEYIMPMYELAEEITNFIDDGTCPEGWGTGRHDQTLFSIKARELKLNILNHDRPVEECILVYNNTTEPFHITHANNRVREDTAIYRSHGRIVTQEMYYDNVRFIKSKD